MGKKDHGILNTKIKFLSSRPLETIEKKKLKMESNINFRHEVEHFENYATPAWQK